MLSFIVPFPTNDTIAFRKHEWEIHFSLANPPVAALLGCIPNRVE